MKECPKCKTLHNKAGTFCSRQCANSRSWSKEHKEKLQKSIKNQIKFKEASEKLKKPKIIKNCIICNKIMYVNPCQENKKCCSLECAAKHISNVNKGNTGGYRENSGRSIQGYYNNIFCGSTYELVWVIYNLYHNIKFKRCDFYILYDNNKKYYPDFILGDNTIIEIKGFHTPLVDLKLNAAKSQGYNIKILYKKDLDIMFNWFKVNFPGKKLQEMYQNYKPKYTYICDRCNKEFSTNNKRKSKVKFCSKYCKNNT